jgi:penicillin-binding protein 1A
VPFSAQPFFGKFSRSGGKTGKDEQSSQRAQPGAGQQGVSPGADGQGTGKGGTQYPPDAYSAPPQQAPNTQEPPATPPANTPPAADQGGTTAPTPG